VNKKIVSKNYKKKNGIFYVNPSDIIDQFLVDLIKGGMTQSFHYEVYKTKGKVYKNGIIGKFYNPK
jgi:hypothetical protein